MADWRVELDQDEVGTHTLEKCPNCRSWNPPEAYALATPPLPRRSCLPLAPVSWGRNLGNVTSPPTSLQVTTTVLNLLPARPTRGRLLQGRANRIAASKSEA